MDEGADRARLEQFAGRMRGVLNGATLALMTSIGHQTGLFEVMARLPPASSPAIAGAAGLDERYVREWLGAMITGRIVEYDPAAGTYHLPPEHAAILTRAAGPDNVARCAQWVALVGNVEQAVVEAFRRGGGVGYAAFPRIRGLQAEERRQLHDASLLSTVLPAVPGITEALGAGIEVLDVRCSDGHAVALMAAAFPRSRFFGIDASAESVAAARAECDRARAANARFEVADPADLPGPARYDFISALDGIHDHPRPARLLRGVAASLRPGGTFLMVDIAASSDPARNLDHPFGPMLYTLSTMVSMTASLAQGGPGLGTMWGEEMACGMLAEAGFARVDVLRMPGDVLHNYYVARTA